MAVGDILKMRNFSFEKNALRLELIKFKGPVYVNTIKGKTSLENGGLVKINYKIKQVKSIVIFLNQEKDVYETESEAFCERLASEE